MAAGEQPQANHCDVCGPTLENVDLVDVGPEKLSVCSGCQKVVNA